MDASDSMVPDNGFQGTPVPSDFKPMSWMAHLLLIYGGILTPLFCHWLSFFAPMMNPLWQTGEWRDKHAFILTPSCGIFFYPLMIYSMVCLGIYLANETKGPQAFFVKLGLWCGIPVSVWYIWVYWVVVLQIENGLALFLYVVMSLLILTLIPLLLRGLAQAIKWIFRKYVHVTVSIGVLAGLSFLIGIGAYGPESVIGSVIAAPIVFTGLFGPGLTLMAYGFVSYRNLAIDPSSRQVSLAQLLAGLGSFAVFCAACRFSVAQSLLRYQSLPVEPVSRCYVVTAAARGHRRCVGAGLPEEFAAGYPVNRQLQRLKAFEITLCVLWPNGHRNLRRVYDRFGPLLASSIRNPWIADAAYLSLKPAEWLARLVLRICLGRHLRIVYQLYRVPRRSAVATVTTAERRGTLRNPYTYA
jgi:hypothetical protein